MTYINQTLTDREIPLESAQETALLSTVDTYESLGSYFANKALNLDITSGRIEGANGVPVGPMEEDELNEAPTYEQMMRLYPTPTGTYTSAPTTPEKGPSPLLPALQCMRTDLNQRAAMSILTEESFVGTPPRSAFGEWVRTWCGRSTYLPLPCAIFDALMFDKAFDLGEALLEEDITSQTHLKTFMDYWDNDRLHLDHEVAKQLYRTMDVIAYFYGS